MVTNQIKDIVAFIAGASGWVSIKTQGYVEATLHPAGGVDGRRQGKPWSETQIEDFIEGEAKLVLREVYQGKTRSMVVTDKDSGNEMHIEISGSYTKGFGFAIKSLVQPA